MMRTKEDYKHYHWDGGESKELFIFPMHAEYKNQDFRYRISITSMEKDNGTYCQIPDVARKIVLLDGACKVSVNDSDFEEMDQKGELDFLGDRKVSCRGDGVDISLMFRGTTDGEVICMDRDNTEFGQVKWDSADHVFFYQHKGSSVLNIITDDGDVEQISLQEEESYVLIQDGKLCAYEFVSMEQDSSCILCNIRL